MLSLINNLTCPFVDLGSPPPSNAYLTADKLEVPERRRKSLIGHQHILAALKQRNAASAEAAMRRHLVEVERIVLQQL